MYWLFKTTELRHLNCTDIKITLKSKWCILYVNLLDRIIVTILVNTYSVIVWWDVLREIMPHKKRQHIPNTILAIYMCLCYCFYVMSSLINRLNVQRERQMARLTWIIFNQVMCAYLWISFFIFVRWTCERLYGVRTCFLYLW